MSEYKNFYIGFTISSDIEFYVKAKSKEELIDIAQEQREKFMNAIVDNIICRGVDSVDVYDCEEDDDLTDDDIDVDLSEDEDE